MSLKASIGEDMKAAMKAREAQRLSAIRLLLAAIKQREVDERKELSDAEVVTVIEKMIKQRRDSIAQFQAANRKDLVDVETFELNLLSGYLPKQLTDAEIEREVSAAIAQTGAKGAADMGKVMGALKGKLAGRADMGKISSLVKSKLAG
ncbi:MAG: GatB/YqeY domain-containing protein [Betaproteobacteria bacterium]|nr:MAG: GatB/YqeY domain-containing protein [Betaproteobacteria bacterium]TMH78736.1 MAG: GatB/YqeY domain-containing protein [Betaproteobacteria bacterium]